MRRIYNDAVPDKIISESVMAVKRPGFKRAVKLLRAVYALRMLWSSSY